jgi:hypothetical protein
MSRHTHRLPLLFLLALNAARAHEHDEDLSEEAANAPIDTILWIHIFLQAAVWGILFPIGMVLGLSRSRWHVPLQVRPRPRPLPSFHPSYSFSLFYPLFFLPPFCLFGSSFNNGFTLANPSFSAPLL